MYTYIKYIHLHIQIHIYIYIHQIQDPSEAEKTQKQKTRAFPLVLRILLVVLLGVIFGGPAASIYIHIRVLYIRTCVYCTAVLYMYCCIYIQMCIQYSAVLYST